MKEKDSKRERERQQETVREERESEKETVRKRREMETVRECVREKDSKKK